MDQKAALGLVGQQETTGRQSHLFRGQLLLEPAWVGCTGSSGAKHPHKMGRATARHPHRRSMRLGAASVGDGE